MKRFAAAALLLAASANAEAPRGPFEVKSGIVEMTTDMMGAQKQTMYFDDYGKKQAIYSTVSMTMMGQTINSSSVTITADGKSIEIDLDKKTGKSRKVPTATSSVPDPATFTKEMKAQYKYEELPEKEIAGKKCKGFTMEPMKGMPMKAWTWKGVPMLSETRIGNGVVTMTTTSFQENAAIPPEKFKVPADVKVTEY